MAEYIDREKAIETARLNYCKNCNSINGIRCRGCGFDDAMLELESVPSADVGEVVHGEWTHIKDYGDYCLGYCSVCWTPQGATFPSALKEGFRYCRWCGAKMRGDRNDL